MCNLHDIKLYLREHKNKKVIAKVCLWEAIWVDFLCVFYKRNLLLFSQIQSYSWLDELLNDDTKLLLSSRFFLKNYNRMTSPWTLHFHKKYTQNCQVPPNKKKLFNLILSWRVCVCVCVHRGEKEYYVVHIARTKCHTPWKKFRIWNVYIYFWGCIKSRHFKVATFI